MQHRILAAATIAGALWAHGTAAACDLSGPYLGTGPRLPLGCPLHVYSGPGPRPGAPFAPMVTTLRSAGYVDVTGAVNPTVEELQVEQTFLPCSGSFQPPPQHNMEPYSHFAISLQNVQVGDQIGVGTGWLTGIAIVAAGPCATPVAPMPACTEDSPCFGDPPFDDVIDSPGCHAAGGGSLWAGAALLGLRRRARRRR